MPRLLSVLAAPFLFVGLAGLSSPALGQVDPDSAGWTGTVEIQREAHVTTPVPTQTGTMILVTNDSGQGDAPVEQGLL